MKKFLRTILGFALCFSLFLFGTGCSDSDPFKISATLNGAPARYDVWQSYPATVMERGYGQLIAAAESIAVSATEGEQEITVRLKTSKKHPSYIFILDVYLVLDDFSENTGEQLSPLKELDYGSGYTYDYTENEDDNKKTKACCCRFTLPDREKESYSMLIVLFKVIRSKEFFTFIDADRIDCEYLFALRFDEATA